MSVSGPIVTRKLVNSMPSFTQMTKRVSKVVQGGCGGFETVMELDTLITRREVVS